MPAPSILDQVLIAVVPEEYAGQETLGALVSRVFDENPAGGWRVQALALGENSVTPFDVRYFDSQLDAETAEMPLGTACWPKL